ncbi:protein maelstrom homolog [Actinia tenebrosa]|uniref:Protein maelstrom homolog n=1 Tax=Actinia tenebrosa TaxID=6105 RepID=A0A6P8HJN7_ACTTE|nr:protein maelstrom homolog [Actinia tenebrosa]
MPNKKNKNQPKNAFYYYMISLRPQLERQGVVLANGMQSLAELAGPRWKDLPEHEKEVYQEMARQAKANKQSYGGLRNDRRDCTGQLLSQRVDTVSLNENKRRRQREEVKSAWPPGKLVCDERFFFIGFMSLCPASSDDLQLPCELGVAEFSINRGIINTMHRFIHPGEIPLGYRYECMSTSEKTHKIPIEGLVRDEDTHQRILWDLLRFVNPDGHSVFPPVYSRASETKLTEACLDCLARNAEMPNRLKKVYELEGLITDLHSHIATEGQSISKAQATDLISTTVFDYEPGARCEWHDEQEVKYCALGTVKRYSYCMADFLCPHYNVPLSVNHVPERPEGSFCTVLSGQENNTVNGSRNNNNNNDDDDDETNLYASYNRTDRPQMDGGSGNTMESFHRFGPTYESDDIQSYRNGTAINPPSQLPQYNYPQRPSIPGGGGGSSAPFGRGRGRGRGVPSSQFVRQPNMAAAHSVGYSGSEPGYPGGAARPTSKAPVSGSVLNYASKGRGVSRIPNTTPKVYSGSANAPHPSFAPPPPLAWQQPPDHYQQQQQQQQIHRLQNRQKYQGRGGGPYQENNVSGRRNVSDVMNMMAHMSMFENQ